MAQAPFASFRDFWPHYLGEHRKPLTRAAHFVGTNVAVVLALIAFVTRAPWVVLLAVASPYAIAWASHYTIEHNHPATFRHPLWSFAGDWKMWALIWTRRLPAELRRLGLDDRDPPVR